MNYKVGIWASFWFKFAAAFLAIASPTFWFSTRWLLVSGQAQPLVNSSAKFQGHLVFQAESPFASGKSTLEHEITV
jgi:hypothetical protein